MSTHSAAVQQGESSRPAAPYVATADGRRRFASDLPVEQMKRTIHYTVQPDSVNRQGGWEPHEDALSVFLQSMLVHEARATKDGRAIVPGKIIGGARNKKALAHLEAMVFDLDRSRPEDIEAVLAKLRDDGLAFFTYTTYSHLSTETEVPFDKYQEFAKANGLDPAGDECARHYLREKKKYDDDATKDSRVVEAARQTADGTMVVLSHAPMLKLRLILILDRPFVIVEWLTKGFSEDDVRTRLWTAALEIVAREYGLSYDVSCKDVCRVFYPASCPVAKLPQSYQDGYFGNALRLDAVVPATPEALDAIIPRTSKAGKVNAKPGKSQGSRAAGGPARTVQDEFEGRNIVGWLGEFGHSYELENALRNGAPDDKFRTPRSEGGTHMECPFEEEHSTTGGTGFFVVNASDNGKYGCSLHCVHQSCQTERGRGNGVDRALYIVKFLRLGWLTLDDLENPELGGGPVPWLKPTKDAIREMISKLDASSTSDHWEPILDALARLGNESFDAEALGLIAGRTGKKNKTALSNAIKSRRRKDRTARSDEARQEFTKASRTLRARQYDVLPFQDWKTLGTLADIGDRAFEHLCQQKADSSKPHEVEIFNHASQHVELRERRGRMQVESLTRDTLTKHLGDCTHWTVPRDSDPYIQVANVPGEIVVRILASDATMLPPLRYLAHSPFFDPAGRLVASPGYHPSCAAYLTGALDVQVPVVPSAEDVEEAKCLLFDEVFEGFPFDDQDDTKDASRAHLLAMLLQPFLRLMIDGPCPVYGVMKPTAGTGGTLLVEAVSLIAFGRSADVSPEPKGTEGEWFKDILAHVAKGSEIAFYDNLHRAVKDDAFASAITAPVIVGRELRTNRHIEGPMLGLWVLCANNLRVSAEVARRTLPICLDTGMPDPKVGREFRHPQLREWIREHRTKLVRACLVLIQNWIAKGKEPWTGKPLASFEAFSATMGGVLEAAGIKGFLGNVHLLVEGGDEEAFRAFVECWWKAFGNDWRGVGSIGPMEKLSAAPPEDLIHLYTASGVKFWFDKLPRTEWGDKMHSLLRVKLGTTHDIDGARLKLRRKKANTGQVYMLETQLRQKGEPISD